MENYADIFQARGKWHAEAFDRYPDAVSEEVGALLRLAAPMPNEVVLDLPAASGFLSRHLNVPGVQLLAVEPSAALYELCQLNVKHTYRAPLHDLPIADGQVDVAICLAGLHHEQALDAIFREVFRVLRKPGRFAIAEVSVHSKTAEFLNGFVDRHSSLGHQGSFASDAYLAQLGAAGFAIAADREAEYHWRFASTADLGDCLRLMFGIDRASPEQIVAAARDVLGLDTLPDGSVGMRWSLRHFLCVKAA